MNFPAGTSPAKTPETGLRSAQTAADRTLSDRSAAFAPSRRRARLSSLTLPFLLLICLLPGCNGSFLNENDTLRAANMDLEEKLRIQTHRAAGLEAALEAEKVRNQAGRPALPLGLSAPVISRLEIDSYSGRIEQTDAKPGSVRIYVATLDQYDRFSQAFGEMSVSVVATPAGGQAITLAAAAIAPRALHETYRAGLTGTHYTLVIPLDKAPPIGIEELTVQLTFHDYLSGRKVSAQGIIKANQPLPGKM